jgi:adenine C2-methylase RlmN of 23S rRNA A2503 and tRNA A37
MRKIIVTWIIRDKPTYAQLDCNGIDDFSYFTQGDIVITFARKKSGHAALNTSKATNLQKLIAEKLLAIKVKGITVIDKITFDYGVIKMVNHSFPWSQELVQEVERAFQTIEEIEFEFVPPGKFHATTTMSLQ